MKMKALSAAAAIVLCGGAAYWYWDDVRMPEAVKACRAELVRDLRSPSSFDLIAWEVMDERISKDQYARNRCEERDLLNVKCIAKEKENLVLDDDPVIRHHIIEYDAQNAFGAVIRGKYDCSYELMSPGVEVDKSLISIRSSRRVVELINSIRD